MSDKPAIPPDQIRRIRRQLDLTQAELARRLDVDQVTVARWETGQRRCSEPYAAAIRRLDPDRRRAGAAATTSGAKGRDEATVSALAQLVRAFFDGSTARAVSALLSRERLSRGELDTLARLIEEKRKER